MSRTRRAVPAWGCKANKELIECLERGNISIPKLDPDSNDDVWGQLGKKWRRKYISRQRRLAEKGVINEQLEG
jgi:hypothetical protein